MGSSGEGSLGGAGSTDDETESLEGDRAIGAREEFATSFSYHRVNSVKKLQAHVHVHVHTYAYMYIYTPGNVY